MRYLCLHYPDPKAMGALSTSEREVAEAENERCLQRLRHGRQGGLSVRLHPEVTATTVGVRGARTRIEDGPATRAGVAPHALLVIEARDLNDAIRIVAQMPWARYGAVEIRPTRCEWTDRSPPGGSGSS